MNKANSLDSYFEDLPDPRVMGRCDYKLTEIIIIAICAVLSGAEGWEDIEEFGISKTAWLKQFLELDKGIPSQDTFRRVFSLLAAVAFQERFIRWVEGVFTSTQGQVVAIDGKTARGSDDQTAGQNALHLVSAWASTNGLGLGQRTVDTKANEITAIPALLEQVSIAGCIVTIDARGCQTAMAPTIIERHADYVLTLKGNQGHLYEDVQEWFAWAKQSNFAQMTYSTAQTVNKGHGRLEIRRCYALSDPRAFEVLRHHDGWVGLQSIVMVERERRDGDQVQHETAYFISSLPADAKRLL